MQRRRKDNRIRWKKIGGGVHYHQGGQVVHKGEILLATEMEILPFRSLFVPLDPLPSAKPIRSEYSLKMVYRGGGRYNVVRGDTGEIVNAKALSKTEAEELITDE